METSVTGVNPSLYNRVWGEFVNRVDDSKVGELVRRCYIQVPKGVFVCCTPFAWIFRDVSLGRVHVIEFSPCIVRHDVQLSLEILWVSDKSITSSAHVGEPQ